MQTGVPAVTVPQPEGAMQVLIQHAKHVGVCVCNNICPKHGINVRLSYIFILFIQYSLSVSLLFQNVLYLVPPLEDYESPSSHIKLPMGGPAQHLNATLALQLCNIWLQSETKGTSNIDMIDKQ